MNKRHVFLQGSSFRSVAHLGHKEFTPTSSEARRSVVSELRVSDILVLGWGLTYLQWLISSSRRHVTVTCMTYTVTAEKVRMFQSLRGGEDDGYHGYGYVKAQRNFGRGVNLMFE